MANQERRRNLIFAISTFIFSTCGAFIAYAKVHHGTVSGHSILDSFPGGVHHYNILSADRCIGFLHYELVGDDESYTLTAKGKLAAKVYDREPVFNISVEGQFNRLGQLGGSIVEFSSEGRRIVAGTTGINPISLKLRTYFGNSFGKKDFALPGPITLKEYRKNIYGLQYPFLSNFDPMYERISDQPVFEEFALTMNLADEETHCYDAELEGLNLTPLVAAVQQMGAALPKSFLGTLGR